MVLALVKDLRDLRAPLGDEEVADFETDVLAGFVLARAATGLVDSTIRNDANHLGLIRDWFGRPLWEMQPAGADAYFGKVLRDAKPSTRTGRASAPGQARAFLVAFVRAGGAELYMQDGCLVVSELVTNVVLHGGTDMSVDLELTEAGLEIGVCDDGPGEPGVIESGRRGPGGRGLVMVARLARDWGVQFAEGGGKRVWCLLSRSTAAVLVR